MKKCFMLLAAIIVTLCAYAVDPYNVVSIHLNDNSKVDLLLNDEVKMSFTETHLVVEGLETEVTIERSKLAKFTHSYDSKSAIESVEAVSSTEVNGDKVLFHSLPANTVVSVYSLGGVEVKSVVAEGDFELNLNGLSSGVYIVSAQGNSLKVTVK